MLSLAGGLTIPFFDIWSIHRADTPRDDLDASIKSPNNGIDIWIGTMTWHF